MARHHFLGFVISLLLTGMSWAQQPAQPPKPDVPFLIHASQLVETEVSQASEDSQKNEMRYFVAGASSPVQTPLAGPEFLFLSEKVDPNTLKLFQFESRNGRREILLRRKDKMMAQPQRMTVLPLENGLAKIRVYDSLDNGEYCLTPDGSNTVFCFSVF
jgi:hypothetical protein